ncbi:MAG: phosphate propanoyltransferase [Treponema sp.]|jgi:putative phosphotransacetylase|nr:phosphate propanoyltransferase [Treponema sp.]
MEETALKQLVRNVILTNFARQGLFYLPVAVSARHVHLSKGDFRTLFGPEASMTRYRELSQPGQFASEQTVELLGPRGTGASFKKVRVLGPERGNTQVEISVSDSFTLGIKPVIRMSGNVAGTPGCTLKGPAGTVELKEGVIVAARHVHMSEEQAAAYGVKDGGIVAVKAPPPREGVIGGIVVRCGKGHDLEIHLDTDEANGNGILCGTILEALVGNPAATAGPGQVFAGARFPAGSPDGSAAGKVSALELVTEKSVNDAAGRGEKAVYVTAKGFISPAAADRAKVKGIQICRLQG